jgi:hypothetical protein
VSERQRVRGALLDAVARTVIANGGTDHGPARVLEGRTCSGATLLFVVATDGWWKFQRDDGGGFVDALDIAPDALSALDAFLAQCHATDEEKDDERAAIRDLIAAQ